MTQLPTLMLVMWLTAGGRGQVQDEMCQTSGYRDLPVEVQNEHQCMVLERLQRDVQQHKAQGEEQYGAILNRMNKLEHNILRKMNRAKMRTNVNEGTGFPALKDIPVARDCNELKMSGVLLTGVYPVKLPNGLVLNVLCDMDIGQGGWTVIQRRLDGSVNFTRVWDDYTFGFGNVNGEFWLGNENIYNLLHDTNYTLRIDIWDWEDDHAYAQYSYMKLDGEDQDYRLHLGTYNGTAGDSFSYHNGMRFTTPDRDNDMWWANCGKKDQSGWWFNACSYSSLNGVYHRLDNTTQPRRPSPDGTHTGVQWFNWKSDPAYSMKRVEMKVKPKIAIMIENQDELRDPVYG